jgi:hypothetical protein
MTRFDLSNGGFPAARGVYASRLDIPIDDGTDVTIPLVFDPEGDSANCLFPVQVGI